MKKPVTMTVGLGIVLAVFVVVIGLVLNRPRVSLKLVDYKRWPHGVILHLTNGTQSTIQYLAEPNDTPAGNPILHLQKTPSGWTNISRPFQSVKALDPRTGKTIELFYVTPAAVPKPGDRVEAFMCHELKPGRKVDFFIPLQSDAPPIRVGTIVIYPEGWLTKKLQPCLDFIKRTCKIKTTLPGQIEIWCPQPIYLPSSGGPRQ